MSVEAFQAIYPQIHIESEVDVELLWGEELKYKTLDRKSYLSKMDLDSKDYLYKDQMEADYAFYRANPEWFGYLVLGREFLKHASKSKQFSMFMPFQVDFMDTFIDPTVSQMGVVACRGGAKSWLLAYCSVLDAITVPQTEISILAGSDDESKKVYKYVRDMCTHEKSGIGQNYDQFIKKDTGTEMYFANESVIERFVCSSTSTRGPRATKLVLDEVTQIKEDILEGFLGQATTSPDFKLAWGGTPDDPGHIAHTKWWCNQPENTILLPNGTQEKCHHWINYDFEDPDLSWHLFHWDVYDCHVDKGGWMYDRTIRAIKKLYKSLYKRRRELFAEWTSESGTILDINDIQLASSKSMREFPKRIEDYNGVIISVDGARHAHYATILMTGWRLGKAHVLYAKGWQHIKGKDLENYIMAQVAYCLDHHVKPIVIIEEAPVSVELIDNIREKCTRLAVFCDTSTFKHKKNKMVEHVCGYFETGMIQIPAEFIQVINECMMWRWADTVDSEGHKVPVKGNDDFIDNLSHALYNDYRLKDKGQDKQHAGAAHDESKMSETLRVFKTGGYNPNSFNREW